MMMFSPTSAWLHRTGLGRGWRWGGYWGGLGWAAGSDRGWKLPPMPSSPRNMKSWRPLTSTGDSVKATRALLLLLLLAPVCFSFRILIPGPGAGAGTRAGAGRGRVTAGLGCTTLFWGFTLGAGLGSFCGLA